MSEEEQRIAIAEACGWKWKQTNNASSSYFQWIGPNGEMWAHGQFPPDYLHDLNACHEMEKHLDTSGDEVPDYAKYVFIAMQDAPERFIGTIHANAAQRCEAFLRVKGLWKD